MNLGSLFSTATSFLGGIQTYLIVGAASLAIGFAGGYYVAVSQAERNASAAPAKAAQAQKKHDDKVHDLATEVSKKVGEEHKVREKRLEDVFSDLSKLPPPKDCPTFRVPADVIKLLNEAGR